MDILVDIRSYMRSIEEYEHSKNGEVTPTTCKIGGGRGAGTLLPRYTAVLGL